MSVNQNPESTWGMTEAQKERWYASFAPEHVDQPAAPAAETEIAEANPESTWGKQPEKIIEWRQANVDDFDINNPVGAPTEVGIHDPNAIPTVAQPMTVDSGAAVVNHDDREEYVPIYAPDEDSDQDFTPHPADTIPAPVPSGPEVPRVDGVSVEDNPQANNPVVDTDHPAPTLPAQEPTVTPPAPGGGNQDAGVGDHMTVVVGEPAPAETPVDETPAAPVDETPAPEGDEDGVEPEPTNDPQDEEGAEKPDDVPDPEPVTDEAPESDDTGVVPDSTDEAPAAPVEEPTEPETTTTPPEEQGPPSVTTVDGMENTASPSSSTGGADVSQ